jgi:hypothetical protein
MHARLAVMVLISAGLARAAVAAETCHSLEHQFGKTRTCASSVLAPQGERTHGPNHLIIGEDGAWCEGSAGPGIGQSVTIHMQPRPRFRTISIINGYARTDETFGRNGRVKRAYIEAEGGYKTAITLKDTREPQRFRIPTSRALWIKFTIAGIYPGTSGSDTCLTWLSVDHEELNN